MLNRPIRKMNINMKQVATLGNRVSNDAVLVGKVASILGEPEIGVPLIAAGKAGKKISGLLKQATKK